MDWNGFKRYIESEYCKRTYITYWNYAKQYFHLLFSGDLSPLLELSPSKRHHVLESLTCLSKYLGVYKWFKELRESYGIKWSYENSESLIINRMLKMKKKGNILEWVRLVKETIPQISPFMDFMVTSGLRYEEALNSYNLIIRLNGNGLEDYYHDEILEHYRFPEVFFRRTKKVFISIIPETLIELIKRRELLTEAIIRRRLQRKHIPLRFGDIREFWGNFMLKHLNPAEVDFLQGRIGVSVFMQNYFNPILIDDLKDRVLKALTELQNSIS